MSGENDEVRPLDEQEAKSLVANFSTIANLLQVGVNIGQRQYYHNAALFDLYKGDLQQGIDFKTKFSGMSSRVGQNAFVVGPALCFRRFVQENGAPAYVSTMFAVGLDSTLGVAFDLNGSKAIMETLGVNFSKQNLAKITSASFVPFAVRNSLTWAAINDRVFDSIIDEMFDDRMSGMAKTVGSAFVSGVAGVVSTPFHNVGMDMAVNAAKELAEEGGIKTKFCEALGKVTNNLLENKQRIFAGSSSRFRAMALSKLILSPQTTEVIENTLRDIFSNQDPGTPGKSPSPTQKTIAIQKDSSTNSPQGQGGWRE